jgi:hypothetical protein
MRYQLFILLGFLSIAGLPQSGPVVFNNSVNLKNGIYTSFYEVLKNSPKYPDCTLQVRQQLLDTAYFQYLDPDQRLHDYEDPLFAVVKNDILYVRYRTRLCKVLIRDAVSIMNKELTYYLTYRYVETEDHIFMVDFRKGTVKKLNADNLEEILVRDPVLYEEFSKLSVSKKRKSLYSYILKYNDRNPVYMELR